MQDQVLSIVLEQYKNICMLKQITFLLIKQGFFSFDVVRNHNVLPCDEKARDRCSHSSLLACSFDFLYLIHESRKFLTTALYKW